VSGINELRPNPGATRRKRRIGRGMGSGHGKTSGRGHKGMWSRSGRFTNAVFKKRYAVINVGDLARLEGVEPGARIGAAELREAGIIRRIEQDGLRVLGGGSIERNLHVVAQHFSKSAEEKIGAAGGTCEVVSQ
jgi:large subunit ribosomal protein L15